MCSRFAFAGVVLSPPTENSRTKAVGVDSQWYVTDPKIVHVPVAELLSKEYLAARAKLFDPSKTNPEVNHVCLVGNE